MSHAGAGITKDLRRAVNNWLPKRRETIKSLEQLADRIQYCGRIANGIKLGGNAVGAISGLTSAALGVATIVTTGGLATPFVVAGTVAAGAGIAGAATAGGAEVTKSVVLSSLLQEAQKKVNKEIDAYLTVIVNISRLYIEITNKGNIDDLAECHYLTMGAIYFCDAGVNVMAACSNILHNYFTKLASHAAVKAAITTVKQTTEITTEALAKITISAAEEATNTTVGLILKHMYQNSTEMVITAAGDTASEVALAMGKGLSDEALVAAVETATANAARSAGKSIAKESVNMTGEVLDAGGWRLISTSLQVANKLLPLVNFWFAIWDATECVKAGRDIAWGSNEEKILRDKIEQLKDEANTIIDEIFNPTVSKNKLQIGTPFPKP